MTVQAIARPKRIRSPIVVFGGGNGRTNQNDTPHFLVIECFDGCRNRKISFTRAGRADSKRQVVFTNILQIAGLIFTTRPNLFAAGLHQNVAASVIVGGVCDGFLLHNGFLQMNVDSLGIKAFATGQLE